MRGRRVGIARFQHGGDLRVTFGNFPLEKVIVLELVPQCEDVLGRKVPVSAAWIGLDRLFAADVAILRQHAGIMDALDNRANCVFRPMSFTGFAPSRSSISVEAVQSFRSKPFARFGHAGHPFRSKAIGPDAMS